MKDMVQTTYNVNSTQSFFLWLFKTENYYLYLLTFFSYVVDKSCINGFMDSNTYLSGGVQFFWMECGGQ